MNSGAQDAMEKRDEVDRYHRCRCSRKALREKGSSGQGSNVGISHEYINRPVKSIKTLMECIEGSFEILVSLLGGFEVSLEEVAVSPNAGGGRYSLACVELSPRQEDCPHCLVWCSLKKFRCSSYSVDS
jgi:hypothetical protein